ncbi:YdeI/OmpD-associated family protein [Leifsonia naganoensis]|uniref:Bifunctional DNA-binding transcriptional regulator/antitoxin component of YhaV-PrlF toxin-antitoxin module n=1 Tax=Leifsonia naganoensis TaxID=150025 RepID=A0A853DKV1_9MICO|nr:YdeI/OmpD-associated family protein [Leifsonia naganoensis]NYK09726.1 bifunctional DNA-binding transcriptional regulator/antitoxin component of YhaV-PrlF toxin-antitoxin module [Leifsonia naganoensis]
MTFRAVLQLDGATATGIVVPPEVVEALGGGGRIPVRATVAGVEYPSTIAMRAGQAKLPVSADIRTRAGIAAGDDVEVDLVRDDQPRTVEVPEDLAAALAAVPGSRERFDALSVSNRKRHVLAVEGAKAAETRARRVAKVLEELAG